MNTDGVVGVWGSSQRCVYNGSATQSRKTRAGTPSHGATPTVLVFQEALGFACVRDMVRFVEFTKLVYVKKQWKCLRKSLFGDIFFVVFFNGGNAGFCFKKITLAVCICHTCIDTRNSVCLYVFKT